jgi:hypothetical protein
VKTANQLARRVGGARQEWANSRLAKIAEESKSGDTVELESKRDLAMATPQKVFPFYSPTKRNDHPNRLR